MRRLAVRIDAASTPHSPKLAFLGLHHASSAIDSARAPRSALLGGPGTAEPHGGEVVVRRLAVRVDAAEGASVCRTVAGGGTGAT